MLNLPKEIQNYIFSFLNNSQFFKLREVHKEWNSKIFNSFLEKGNFLNPQNLLDPIKLANFIMAFKIYLASYIFEIKEGESFQGDKKNIENSASFLISNLFAKITELSIEFDNKVYNVEESERQEQEQLFYPTIINLLQGAQKILSLLKDANQSITDLDHKYGLL